MADGEVFTDRTGQGLVVSTGILGDLVLPEGAFDPGRADEIRALAAQAAVYATQARGPGTLRAYPAVLNRAEALDSTVVTERQAEVWRRPALPEGRPRWGRSGRW